MPPATLRDALICLPPGAPRAALIYLRQSDFRDEDGDPDVAFGARRDELVALAAGLGLHVADEDVLIENDLGGNGKTRGATAYKARSGPPTPAGSSPTGPTGPCSARVRPPPAARHAQGADRVRHLPHRPRRARRRPDARRLPVRPRAVITPGEDGEPRWVLTQGGSPDEVDAFKDRVADARRFSADIGAKVRKGRRRWAGTSYHGGPRMFGLPASTTPPAARGPQPARRWSSTRPRPR